MFFAVLCHVITYKPVVAGRGLECVNDVENVQKSVGVYSCDSIEKNVKVRVQMTMSCCRLKQFYKLIFFLFFCFPYPVH